LRRVLENQTEDITDHYALGKVLGQGQFGTTRICTEHATGKVYACKSISKRKLIRKTDKEDVQREVQILHHLGGHANITQLKGAYEDRHNVHLVMELCSGGELFDRIVSRGHYSEKDAAGMCRTIVKVIGHCHSLGVMHRDLKPENFLLAGPEDDAPLKACDFGLSLFFRPNDKFKETCGSAFYIAPEVLKGSYSKEADIFSAGVILYILLSGVPPFYGETEQQIFDEILKGKIDLERDPWPRISDDAKDCVKQMLQPDPAKRATADQILQHRWMKEHGTASSAPLDNIILKRMQGFSSMNKLKRQALQMIALNMDPAELAGLKAIFQGIDKDGSGTITLEEMKQGLREQGSIVSQKELDALVSGLDADHNGTIDYQEFLAGTISLSTLNKRENLLSVFEQFDKDNSGYLTIDELEHALTGEEGGDVSDDIKQIIKDFDKDGDGRIDFEEFATLMTTGNDAVMYSKSTLRRQDKVDTRG